MDGNDMFEALQSQDNVTIKLYNPVNVLKPWNGICRMHDKYLIVDNYGYMLGGRNTFNLFLGRYNSGYKNHDLEVFVWNKGTKGVEYIEKSYARGEGKSIPAHAIYHL